MSDVLSISLGQYSDKGVKDLNQDFHGALIPEGRSLASHGITVALADGISSSSVSQIAAESAIKSFLTDYYCTSEAWVVNTSASRVISATNSWLHSLTKRSQHTYDLDKGYVCTFSALVLKAREAHLFHVGDSRVYRVSNSGIEQLTNDHRVVISSAETYLGRALGMAQNVEIDYRRIGLAPGDVFVLATDGVFEFASALFIAEACKSNDLDAAASSIVNEALSRGSQDNCTAQVLRVDSLPEPDALAVRDQVTGFPPAPVLTPPCTFDGYDILRTLHSNSRSHIYLAKDQETGTRVALKVPSIDLREDQDYLHRMLMEEWIARRVSSPHVLKAGPSRDRSKLYVATEYIEGQTLRQWMRDNPQPDLEIVRDIVEQIVKGLRALHRREMLHQDLRPENVMIDRNGTVKIIDFGSTRVAGVDEGIVPDNHSEILGTAQYTAPEYFVGGMADTRSDQFSLGVITYEMLTGKLPYGAKVSRATSARAQSKLRYISAETHSEDIAPWVDAVLARATEVNRLRRYETMSEFVVDLRRPNSKFVQGTKLPLMQRNPLIFWQALSLVLLVFLILELSIP